MQTGDDILFTAPGPDFGTIPTATTEIVGTPGNSLNVYWIVTHFPIGSVLSGPFPQKGSPNVLDDENYILISWLPAPGASSYDLLFTKELRLPRQPGRFLLEAGLTGTEFRDTGQGLGFYDVAGIPLGAPQEEHIYFDNRDRKQPTLRFIPWPIEVSSIIFEDGSSQNTAGGAAAAPPNQSVQFNDNGAFGGSSNLTWDIVNSRLGIGTTNPQAALDVAGANLAAPLLRLAGDNAQPLFTYLTIPDRLSIADVYGAVIIADIRYYAGAIGFINTGMTISATDATGGSSPKTLNLVGANTGGTGAQVRISSDNTIRFLTQDTESMRITSLGNVGIGTGNPQAALDVNGVISSTYGLFTPGTLNLNSGGNVIQFIAGPGSAALFDGNLNIFIVYQNTIHNGYLAVAGALIVETNGNIEMTNLPSTSPGPGSKRIWYDPADGNIVKYAP